MKTRFLTTDKTGRPMNGIRRRDLSICLISAMIAGSLGCADLQRSRYWPGSADYTDTAAGIVAPADRLDEIRELGKRASGASDDEREANARKLAAAFQGESDSMIRAEIIRSLGGNDTTTAANTLQTAVNDAKSEVRQAACEACGTIGDSDAVESLSRVLASDTSIDVRLAAARALGATGDPAAIAALGDALEDRDPAMQYRAVQSLKQITGEDFGNDANRWRQYLQGEVPQAAESRSVAQRFWQLF